jgi:hypothetical protein
MLTRQMLSCMLRANPGTHRHTMGLKAMRKITRNFHKKVCVFGRKIPKITRRNLLESVISKRLPGLD